LKGKHLHTTRAQFKEDSLQQTKANHMLSSLKMYKERKGKQHEIKIRLELKGKNTSGFSKLTIA
jgi:hypothetical protein